MGDVKEWASLVDFGVVVSDRDPKTIANAVTTILARIQHRTLLDNSKCLEAIDIENIARRIKTIYDDLLDNRL